MSSDSKDYPPGYLNEYCGGELIATAVVFMVLEIAFATIRWYAKRRQDVPIGLDDWFIWPALAVNIILCIEGLILIPLAGVGQHLIAVEARSPEKLIAWSKGVYACVWIWALAVALPKMAIMGFYLRFFKSTYERAITYTLMAITVATFLAIGLTATFSCTPVSYQWEQSIPGAKGKCIDVTVFYDWMSFPNIVTDAIMLVLPLPMIFRLHLSQRQKIGLACIFATGGAGIITSCLRFANFYNRNAFEDNTWTSVQLLKWTDIEPGIYFLAACMPSFGPLFQRAWNKFIAPYVSSLRRSTKGTNGSHSDNGPLALHTIGGGRRDHRSGKYSDARAGGFSRLSEDADETRTSHIQVTSTFTVDHV
ncbi:hypothetical protein N7456_006563 [Penicillium angulare]|uniref:Rhodopsin domain-containing protein n=1 Tax=Penicillium angulare TaxID=116970 RepID=A0A9W9FHX5_9EURO|nr:hypothetical protein N7456_006563 [Penicillium angulare]